jgi:hypothetical protein
MRRRILNCGAVLLLASFPALGADLFYMDHDPVTGQYVGPVGPLVISGEIAPGDYDRLLDRILADQNRFLAQNKIILASDGGDVAEALMVAKLVKSLFTEIIVGRLTGRCVSACFFIYASASQREVDGDRLIGINRPYLVDSHAAADLPSALTPVRAFLRDNAVPDYLADEMFRHASDDAYWLSADDEKNLGYKSQAFNRYLAEKCAWDDSVERDVYAGKRPIGDLKQMLACRTRATQDDARQALALASKERSGRAAERPLKKAQSR